MRTNDEHEGDTVRVIESRPLSRSKEMGARRRELEAGHETRRDSTEGGRQTGAPRSCASRQGGSQRRCVRRRRITATVKRPPAGGVKQGRRRRGLVIVRTKKPIGGDGTYIAFDENACGDQRRPENPRGTRDVRAGRRRELRERTSSKLGRSRPRSCDGADARTMKIRSRPRQGESGKDRGKTGKVLRVEPGRERVYVAGLKQVKRAVRSSRSKSTSPLPNARTARRDHREEGPYSHLQRDCARRQRQPDARAPRALQRQARCA